MAKIMKRYEYVPTLGEINSGEELVETAGYIPADQKISSMIDAGRRLMDFRAGNYEFDEGDEIPDEYLDPTRNPGYDLADASQDMVDASNRLQKKAQPVAPETPAATQPVAPETPAATPPVASEPAPDA